MMMMMMIVWFMCGRLLHQNLMGRFEEMQRLAKEKKARRGSGASSTVSSSNVDPQQPPSHDYTRSIHRCLIYLGDLAR